MSLPDSYCEGGSDRPAMLAICFVGWIMRELHKKGYVNPKYAVTNKGYAETADSIEQLRFAIGKRRLAILVANVHKAWGAKISRQTCEDIAALAEAEGLIGKQEYDIETGKVK